MYVRDLEEGCLVKCRDNLSFALNEVRNAHVCRDAAKELAGRGFKYSGSVVKVNSRNRTLRHYYTSFHDLALYTGKIKLHHFYYGCKTQHTFLIDGIPVVMDGYQMKELEKIE
jgi:FKBP-type peptidyl-prolyl cis-trans isomerase 2